MKIELQLTGDTQSKHVQNFVRHCAKGSYNNNCIVRYIPNFIIQTGDTSNTGKQSISADEENPIIQVKSSQEFNASIQVDNQIERGSILTVNNSKEQDKLGSQFFICLSEEHKESLKDENSYTFIGRVIDGFQAIEKIEQDSELNDPDGIKKNGKPRGKWKKEKWIKSVEIHNNPFSV